MIIAKCYSDAATGQCLLDSEGPLVGKCEQFLRSYAVCMIGTPVNFDSRRPVHACRYIRMSVA